MLFTDLKRKAKEAGHHFEVVLPWETHYDQSRSISNGYFDLHPVGIAYCENAAHAAFCLNFCRDNGIAFRIRSGGHQHEGMCSADGVIIIDLSRMQTIEYEQDDQAWIPVGKPLANVYRELEAKGFIIPGGTCGGVCVGGLTQGAGWGLSLRKYGLTCDTVLMAEVVLPTGEIVKASHQNEHKDLLWALCGGGGGNFGIVTRFLFQLSPLSNEVTSFTIRWSKAAREKVTKAWFKWMPTADRNITTAGRLTVVGKRNASVSPLIIVGLYYGSKEELMKEIAPFYEIATPVSEQIRILKNPTLSDLPVQLDGEGEQPFLFSSTLLEMGNEIQYVGPDAPTDTCSNTSYPHKVSSTFPKTAYDENLVTALLDFLTTSEAQASRVVSQYVSIHAMGGIVKEIASAGRAFPYSQKEFIIKFQAWWTEPNNPNAQTYIDWVEAFRQTLISYTEGAFINFPDRKLTKKNIFTAAGREELLRYYYADNLSRLIQVKSKYDEENLFNFAMSIPTEEIA